MSHQLFEYSGYDINGNEHHGTVPGISEDDAVDKIHKLGIVPNSVRPQRDSPMPSHNDDLRPNKLLEDFFNGVDDAPIKPTPASPAEKVKKAASHAKRGADALKRIGGKGMPPPIPPGSGPPSGGPPGDAEPGGGLSGDGIDLSDATISKLSSAIAVAIGRSAGGNAQRGADAAEGRPGSKYVWNSGAAQWQKVPGDSTQKEGPGAGEKAGSFLGSKAGGLIGKVIGSRYGGKAGGAIGEKAGEFIGSKAGAMAGGAVMAPIDRAVDIFKSGDASNSLEKIMPAAAQSVINWYKNVDKATESMLHMNFQMGEFSAAMGGVKMEREAREAFRSNDIGNRLEGSARYLMNAEQERRDNGKNIQVLASSIDNYAQGFMNKIGGALLKRLDFIAEKVAKMLGIAEESESKDLSPFGLMDSLAKQGQQRFANADSRLANLAANQRETARHQRR